MEDLIARVTAKKKKNVTTTLARLTATGLTGKTGVIVLSRVEEVNRGEHEPVPILQRHLKESRVLGTTLKPERVTRNPVQSTVIGLTGGTGKIVLSRVEEVSRAEHEPVPTPQQHLVEIFVLGRTLKPECATTSLVQSMVTGQTGVPGEHAQSPVVAEVKFKLEVAIILHRHMVDWFASETAINRENATLTHAEDQQL